MGSLQSSESFLSQQYVLRLRKATGFYLCSIFRLMDLIRVCTALSNITDRVFWWFAKISNDCKLLTTCTRKLHHRYLEGYLFWIWTKLCWSQRMAWKGCILRWETTDQIKSHILVCIITFINTYIIMKWKWTWPLLTAKNMPQYGSPGPTSQ